MEVSKTLAAQIVHAVYEVVKTDTNLISPSGHIVGSTDPDRIGSFHAAGAYAAKTGAPVFVDEAHPFEGAKPGINYPIFLNHAPIAVIGLTGDPEALKPFGFLITKITEVFLKEQQLNEEMASESRALHYLITSLIYDRIQDPDQFQLLLDQYGLCREDSLAVLVIRMEDSCPEQALRFYFQSLGVRLSHYFYPNEWIVLFDKCSFASFSEKDFSQKFRGQLHAGLGNFTSLSHASRSYQNALAALRHALNQDLAFCDISTPSAEYLLEAIPGDMKTLFASQLLDGLTEKECSILRTYLSCNMSLKNTADALFIHKNTLQYHLDRIAEKSGKNPRNFQDAFLFQLALFFHI